MEDTKGISNQLDSYNDLYVTAYYVPYVKFYEPPSWTFCSCVEFSKYKLGKEGKKLGNASEIAPDSTQKPEVGILVIFDNHIAVATEISGLAIRIDEGNWLPCQRSQRNILLSDPRIRGYKKP